tara:strand:- start:670 stop:1623 length:954 start_codon:yes stop_codon:yes gene_type:complete
MSEPLDDLMGNALTEPIVRDDGEDIEVSVVDDMPEGDQPAARAGNKGAGESVEELDSLGGRTQRRIKKLQYDYHEERRSKESSERMREEAVQHAQRLASENNDLKDLIQRGEKVLLSEIKSRTEVDQGKAEDDYKRAYESGDTEAILTAQKELNRSQMEQDRASRYQPEMEQRMQASQPAAQPAAQPAPAPPPVDPKLQAWLGRNDWFGKDEELTSFAYGVHEKLVRREGADPRTDDYYAKIDERLRAVFPERMGVETGEEEPSANSHRSTVVAPATRSSGKLRKVQLTSTQVGLAKRLGISPEQYAKQLLKEVRNG